MYGHNACGSVFLLEESKSSQRPSKLSSLERKCNKNPGDYREIIAVFRTKERMYQVGRPVGSGGLKRLEVFVAQRNGPGW